MADIIVHVLHEGFPLCNFTRNFPNNWPPGHKWTWPSEQREATCEKCIELAKKYFPQSPS